MKLISVTLELGEISFTLFREDLEVLSRICNGLVPTDEQRRFAKALVSRAVLTDTGEPVVGC